MRAPSMPADPWPALRTLCHPEVLRAPKTWGDPTCRAALRPIDTHLVAYLANGIAAEPWGDHLVLLALVLYAHNLDTSSIFSSLAALRNRFKRLFPAVGIGSMAEWDAPAHLRLYLEKKVLADESQEMRRRFYSAYCSSSQHLARWLAALPAREQEIYRPFVLPDVDTRNLHALVRHAEMERARQDKRKAETEAIVHRLAEILAAAHSRYALFLRIRAAYLQAIDEVKSGRRVLLCPVYVHEGGDKGKGVPPQEVLTFRLWDRRSFVMAHADAYRENAVYEARTGRGGYTAEKNAYFLEYLSVERPAGDGPPTGIWFSELIARDVLHTNPLWGTPDEVRAKRQWLDAAGYAGLVCPFKTGVAGLGPWSRSDGSASFMSKADKAADGLILPMDNLYPTLTFGLAALDIFCSSGMRINEALQIRTTADCLVTLKVNPEHAAPDKKPAFHFAFRLIPKGQRQDTPASFWVGLETIRLLAKVGKMLQQHYGLHDGEALPAVPFTICDRRRHRFGSAPYLFQLNHQHLSPSDLTVCMRLLVHGLGFQTREGEAVALKAHLLRHAFATWAVQVEKKPIDIIAAILHQKDLAVTRYYARATQRQIAEVTDDLVARITTFIDVGELLVRGPEELRRLLDEARGKRGTLVRVIGGTCTLDGPCAAKFACVGCVAKVVDPDRRQEVEDHKRWNLQQAAWAERGGFVIHQQQHEQQARHADVELREMDLIEAYKEDEAREPDIHFDA